jgi:hypothetical protein
MSLSRALQDASRCLTACRQAQQELSGELRAAQSLLNSLATQKTAVERYAEFLSDERDAAQREAEHVRFDAERARQVLVEEQDQFIQVLLEDHERALAEMREERDRATRKAELAGARGMAAIQGEPVIQVKGKPERPTLPVPPPDESQEGLRIPSSKPPPVLAYVGEADDADDGEARTEDADRVSGEIFGGGKSDAVAAALGLTWGSDNVNESPTMPPVAPRAHSDRVLREVSRTDSQSSESFIRGDVANVPRPPEGDEELVADGSRVVRLPS